MIKLKDITIKNIKSFLQGYIRSIILNRLTHVYEQVEIRINRVNKISPECIANGKCKHCKCTTPELFYADKGCELGCYPKLMNKQEWNTYKNIISIDANN